MSVQQLQIVVALIPTLGLWNDMIDFEGVVLREVQPTCPAAPLLLAEASCHAGADGRMTSQAYAPIHPISIVWTTSGLDFHMALMACVGMADQAYPVVGWLEGPALSVVHTPVFAHDPVLGLVRMAGHGPAA